MKLTYDDCKELKDAGFPQEGDGNYILYEDDTERNVNKEHPDGAYRPTLSELIDSCGEEFQFLKKPLELEPERWQAVSWVWVEPDLGYIQKFGSSPEQAVKNLWIALNNPLSSHSS